MSNDNEIKPCSCKRDKSLWIAIAVAVVVVFILVNLLFFRDNLPNTQILLTITKYVLAFTVLIISGVSSKHFINKYCISIRNKGRNRELLLLGIFSSIVFTLLLIAVITHLSLDYDCVKSLPQDYYYWRDCYFD